MILSVAEFMYLSHLENVTFRKLDLFPSSDEKRKKGPVTEGSSF
jgi:hypothetical protein